MKFLIDTNVVSEAMKKIPDPAVISWLAEFKDDCFLSSITIAEIELGLELLPHGQKRERLEESFSLFQELLEERVLDFDRLIARRWGKFCAQLEKRGRKTPVLDSMIEAIALKWDMTIVTRNSGDFVEAMTLNPWKAAR